MENELKKLGFESQVEFFNLINKVDMEKHLIEFKQWQSGDGTKKGLLEIINQK